MEFYTKTHHLSKNEKRHLGKRLCSRLSVLRNKLKEVRSLEELIAVIPLIYSDLLKDIYSYYSTAKIHQDRLEDLQCQVDMLHNTARYLSQGHMELYMELDNDKDKIIETFKREDIRIKEIWDYVTKNRK